jgi:hypothetical protein
MHCLTSDLLWHCLTFVPSQMMRCRRVCHFWQETVDEIPQHVWKKIYSQRVCSLNVKDSFDWKSAFAQAASRVHFINAHCLWKETAVHIMPPWINETWFYVHTSLADTGHGMRSGIQRLEGYDVLDYNYGGRFRLRARARTCRSRRCIDVCRHCNFPQSKKKCLNLKYEFFLRQTCADEDVDEHLSQCLAAY